MSSPGYENGVYVGSYNLEIRQAYLRYKIMRYLFEHPGASIARASKNARIAWRRKASNGKRK